MSNFEFNLIPIAIIIGFAITRVLAVWASVIRNWPTIQQPWLYLSLSMLLLVTLRVHFTGLWGYRDVEFGSLNRLLLVISPTLFFMLAISLLAPANQEIDGDLEATYFRRVRPTFALAAIAAASSALPDLLPGVVSPPTPWELLYFIVPLAVMASFLYRAVHIIGHLVLWFAIFGLPLIQGA